ncbi:Serine/threonine-protein kinase PrkC [Rosistilla ulvae]|uniref:Serine/threonine-protein kinase PrkC n=1 Tax=Rosistilla ulvae TaxID=1930277 RepID=A0A517M2E0_9BACT|nr:serine/threonine-protein kinase [Rosistilla ulvae]QDS89037.1 Serine/threonine-protein kinase PrkC [Rosistilla ulvae]
MEISDTTDDVLEIVDVLASDFIARYREGDRPTVEEYAHRHPELSDSIRRMFPLVASIERIKIGEQVAEDGSATLAGRVLSQLGDFRIVREIGRGGMGIVFEAHQQSLDRTVAIKVLPKQSLLDDEALARFRTEATTAAAMHHTNIVPIYGTGESDGSHYLVMQLIDGESLDTVIANGRTTSCTDAARIGQQVADAIAYSHASGVLHRDIKPANILIEADGTAQVTDFGLAKNVGTDLTNSRSVSGSLRYMAPERFAGISDQRGDVYAIGLTLYELLAGRPAFEESDAEHLIGSITNPRLQSIQAIRSDVPIDLATIVSKAIQVDPDLRYQSAADLRDDLGRFLSDQPIHARKISVAGRLVRWAGRNPKLAAAITVAAVALLAATIVSTIAYAITSAANQRSVIALKTSEQTVDLALQSLDGIVDVVSGTPASSSIAIDDSFDDDSLPNVGLEPSPVSAKILERLQPIYERLSRQSPTRPDIILQMVDASIQLARIQHALGRTPDSIETLNASVSLLNRSGSRLDFRQTPDRRSGSRQDFRQSSTRTSNQQDIRQPQPASPTDESLDDFRYPAIPHDDLYLRLARLNNDLGEMHAGEFRRELANACYESAIEAASILDGSNIAGRIELARAHLSLGNRPPQHRRGESLTVEQRAADLSHISRAIEILQSLKDSQQQSATINILHARSLLARSRSTRPVAEVVKTFDSPNSARGSSETLDEFRYAGNGKRRDFREAVSILRDQLYATPDDTNVRFELVATLADVNVRGLRSPARTHEVSQRLREALDELGKLRTINPNNALFQASEVHLRHKIFAIARSQDQFDEADAMLSEAIRLQTWLIQTWPDSVRHRCWRAMLYRSQATLYRQWGNPGRAKDAIANAKADLDTIDGEYSDHPLVTRTRDAITQLTNASPFPD